MKLIIATLSLLILFSCSSKNSIEFKYDSNVKSKIDSLNNLDTISLLNSGPMSIPLLNTNQNDNPFYFKITKTNLPEFDISILGLTSSVIPNYTPTSCNCFIENDELMVKAHFGYNSRIVFSIRLVKNELTGKIFLYDQDTKGFKKNDNTSKDIELDLYFDEVTFDQKLDLNSKKPTYLELIGRIEPFKLLNGNEWLQQNANFEILLNCNLQQ